MLLETYLERCDGDMRSVGVKLLLGTLIVISLPYTSVRTPKHRTKGQNLLSNFTLSR